MESKIIIHGFLDQLVINTVQTSHFRDLYLGFFYEMMKKEKAEDCSEGLLKEFGEAYYDWALEELLKIGLVTIYHYWEKCMNCFIKDQAKTLNIRISTKKNEQSFVQYNKKILEEYFTCIMNEEIWAPIEESRKIVNIYKHGNHKDYQLLKSDFPYYFKEYNPKNNFDLSIYFTLGIENFERLTIGIENFWGKIPHELRFS